MGNPGCGFGDRDTTGDSCCDRNVAAVRQLSLAEPIDHETDKSPARASRTRETVAVRANEKA